MHKWLRVYPDPRWFIQVSSEALVAAHGLGWRTKERREENASDEDTRAASRVCFGWVMDMRGFGSAKDWQGSAAREGTSAG